METCSGDILGDEEEVEQVNMAMDMGGSSVPGGGLVSPLLMGAPSPLQAVHSAPSATTPSSSSQNFRAQDNFSIPSEFLLPTTSSHVNRGTSHTPGQSLLNKGSTLNSPSACAAVAAGASSPSGDEGGATAGPSSSSSSHGR